MADLELLIVTKLLKVMICVSKIGSEVFIRVNSMDLTQLSIMYTIVDLLQNVSLSNNNAVTLSDISNNA